MVIGILVVFTIFAQTNFNESTITQNSTTQNTNKSNLESEKIEPKLAQTDEQFYDWNDGNNMTIEAETGANNETVTTIESGDEQLYVGSEIENQHEASICIIDTLRGGNYGIESVKENNEIITTLWGIQIIDEELNAYDVPIELCQSNNSFFMYFEPLPMGYNTSLQAKKNAVGNYLDSFDSQTYERMWYPILTQFNYVRNRADGYDLQFNLTELDSDNYFFKAHMDYNETLNQFKWQETNFDHYIVNESGVYESSDMVDYNLVLEWNKPSLTFYGKGMINITSANNTIVIHYNDMYELLFTKRESEKISMLFTGINTNWLNESFFWFCDYITWFSGAEDTVSVVTIFLWNITDVLYTITWPFFELEIKFLITGIIIGWDWVSIQIWLVENTYLHWIVIFHWLFWSFKVQYWCLLSSRIFTDYVVWIQYSRISKPDLIYIYFVPTYIMPNMLVLNIINMEFTESNFNINFTVKDCFGFLLDVSKISVFWNGDNVSSGVLRTSTGKYYISLAAILVNPGVPGKLLNITTFEYGYAEGNLLTQIAVDPDAVDKDEDRDDGDDGDDGGDDKKEAPKEKKEKPLDFFEFITSPVGLISIGGGAAGATGVAIFLIKKYLPKKKVDKKLAAKEEQISAVKTKKESAIEKEKELKIEEEKK